MAQLRYSEAEPLYQRALTIREKRLGAEHPDLAESLRSYAALLRETKRKPEARIMDARASHILASNPAVNAANQTIRVQELEPMRKGWKEQP